MRLIERKVTRRVDPPEVEGRVPQIVNPDGGWLLLEKGPPPAGDPFTTKRRYRSSSH